MDKGIAIIRKHLDELERKNHLGDYDHEIELLEQIIAELTAPPVPVADDLTEHDADQNWGG